MTRTDQKPDETVIIPKDDTWEKRYLRLVQEVWYMSDEELEEYTYEEDHQDVLDEIKEMNVAIHKKRMENE